VDLLEIFGGLACSTVNAMSICMQSPKSTVAAGHKPPPKEQTHPQSSHREKPPSVAEPCTAATPADMGVLAGIHSPVSDESALHSAALSRSPAGPPPEGKAIPAVARQPKGWMSGNSEVRPHAPWGGGGSTSAVSHPPSILGPWPRSRCAQQTLRSAAMVSVQ